MARILANQINVDAPDSDYPYGRVRNNPGNGTGTPVNEELWGDFHQFFARLLDKGRVIGNDLPDNDYRGFQYMQALQNMLGDTAIRGDMGHDLNDYIEPGIYGVTVSTPLNAPFPIGNVVGAPQAFMIVAALSDTARMQFILTREGFATRGFNIGTLVFDPWVGQYVKTIGGDDFLWDMDTDTTKSIPHGLTHSKIQSVYVKIREDGLTLASVYRPLDAYSSQEVQGGVDWDATNIILERRTGGIFDNTNYNDIADGFGDYSRGQIIITVLV